MKVTKKQIADWIDEYLETHGTAILKREWNGKYIHRHAPYNNSEDCYHKWLKKIEEQKDELMSLPTFEDILEAVSSKNMPMLGIGDLTRYDTATQLAFPKQKFPKDVHLHAGTAKGAKALDIKGKIVATDKFIEICEDFSKLNAAQIEDFLCVYSACLEGDVEKC